MNQPTENTQEAPAENPEVEADQVETGAEATAEGDDVNASETVETEQEVGNEEEASSGDTQPEDTDSDEEVSEPETETKESQEPESDDAVVEPAPESVEEDEPEALLIIDSSVNEDHPIRVHEIIVDGDIVPITFKLGEPTVLPFKQGIKFMKDGFTVKAASGDDLNLPAVPNENVIAQLKADETVAKYGELTFTALKLRASQKKDGEVYLDADEGDRADIIDFLIGNKPQEAESLIEDEGDLSETIDVSEEKVTPDPDALAKKIDAIIRHFGEGLENVTSAQVGEVNGAPVYAVIHKEEGAPDVEIVKGTLHDLYQAVIEGVGRDRFNSDQDAKAPVVDPTFTIDEVESATDEAMRLAVEHGIDINDVVGSGENGNVLVGDVEAYIEASKPEAPAE